MMTTKLFDAHTKPTRYVITLYFVIAFLSMYVYLDTIVLTQNQTAFLVKFTIWNDI